MLWTNSMCDPYLLPRVGEANNVSRSPEENERIVREGFVDKVRRTVGKVPFVDDAVAAYYCATDPGVPTRVKVIIMAALAYFVMPIDAVPDIIAGLGFTDDAAVFWAAWKSISSHITDMHRARARSFLGQTADSDDAPFNDNEETK